MNLDNLLKAVETRSFVKTLFNLIFLVLPGVTILCLFRNSIFMDLDTLKLILLSCAITAPLAVINTIFISKEGATDKDLYWWLTSGVLIAGFSLYFAAILGYLSELPLIETLICAVIMDAVIMLLTKNQK